MPKITSPTLPASALFAINKPSGPTSMLVLTKVKQLLSRSPLFVSKVKVYKNNNKWKKGKFNDLKVGQGGTLDPLASGVLVIGVGKGTKQLSSFLECNKEYEATVLLGTSTTTYDSQGEIVTDAPWKHITADSIRESLPKFTGLIQQIPPVYSALKMDGKPLYEYAREGKPLPRPIEPRQVTVHTLELLSFQNSESSSQKSGDVFHSYKPPSKRLSPDEVTALHATLKSQPMPDDAKQAPDPIAITSESEQSVTQSDTEEVPPVFTIRLSCSGGTYVRTLVHDIANSLGSAAHLVKLVRTRQGDWSLDQTLDWDMVEEALKGSEQGDTERPWEKRILEIWEPVENDNTTDQPVESKAKV